ncbi:MAG: disulfide bond formation protein B [Robiginitomaculum sp.]|nr:disulfide bond formation protein B [Robiginitomaculum sp.]
MNLTEISSAKNWPLLTFLFSAAMLAGAHGFEHIGGMDPCQLCLRQREIYWLVILLAGLLMALQYTGKARKFLRIGIAIIGLVFLAGAMIAGFHVGVELKFWEGPASCSGTMADLSGLGSNLLESLSEPAKAPGCGEVPWSMLGISMAGWNGLISLALAIMSFIVFLRPSKTQVSK